jgi:type VI secretion system VasD/TssJ family lipoprotein
MFINTPEDSRMRFIERSAKPSAVHVLFAALFVLLTSFCSSNYKNVKIHFLSTDNCNKGNPVIVRIHQLQSDATFQTLTIESYLKDPANSLGADQLGKPVEKTVYPGTTLNLDELKISQEAVFIAILADFYASEGDHWRLIETVKTFGGKPVIIECHEKKLVLRKQQ